MWGVRVCTGVLGAGRDCRYSGTRSIGALGVPRGCRGCLGVLGHQGFIGASRDSRYSGTRSIEGISRVLGASRNSRYSGTRRGIGDSGGVGAVLGHQGCIGELAVTLGTHGLEGV